jgi:thiol-disulfide isomerase/thioredoxin
MNLLRLALATGAIALSSACAHAASPTPRNMLPPVALPQYPDGTVVNLDAERGNVVVLDFWATWCEPCKAALPEWESLAEAYRDRGVHLYAVSVDGDPNKIGEFIQEVGLKVPVLLDRDAAVAEGTLHLTIIPTVLIVDRQGAIRGTHQGYAPADVKGYSKEIDPLLAEK